MVENSNTANAEIVGATTLVARLKFLAYAGAVAAFLVVGLYVYNFYGPLAGEAERWGQFGDYVGGVLNPIFGFLALVALLATLGLQIRELRISAMELRNSANALEKQYATLRQQTFEGTFFQTLRLFNEIVASAQDELGVSKGRHYFRTVLEGFLGQLAYGQGENDIEKCLREYEVFYRGFEVPLGHYFRVLYNLVNLVKTTDGVDHRFYTNLIRAQLSDAEQQLLFFNCMSKWGVKFKPLVEEFALLKSLSNGKFPFPGLLHAYSMDAYGAGLFSTKDRIAVGF